MRPWDREVAQLQALGRWGAAFDHTCDAIEEAPPFVAWHARQWLPAIATRLRPVQLTALRLHALDTHCAGFRPTPDRPGARAWFPAVLPEHAVPAGFAAGALGEVVVRRGAGRISGDLAPSATDAIRTTLDLLAGRGLLPWPVDVAVRAPRQVELGSLGLALAAATITLVEELDPLDDVAFTGTLTADGSIGPVTGVQRKRRVLDEEWPGSFLLVPLADDYPDAGCRGVANLDELVALLRGDASEDPAVLRKAGAWMHASRIAWALGRRRSIPNPTRTAGALVAELHAAINTGAQPRALRLAEQLERLLPAPLPDPLRVDALNVLSRNASGLFRYDQALRWIETALRLAAEEDRVWPLRARARLHAERLELDAAIEDAERSLQLAREPRGLLELGEWLRRAGRLDDAQARVDEVEHLLGRRARENGFACLLAARLAFNRGDDGTALAIVPAIPRHVSPGMETAELRIRALLRLGDRDRAQAVRREVDRLFHGPICSTLTCRLLDLRQELALAAPAEEAGIRKRIWALPGFAEAYRDRIADTTEALLTQTPY